VSPTAPTEPSALGRVRAGEITPGEYVDQKIEQATSHLTGLTPAELESIRAELRDRMATDPTLMDLVHTATGVAPSTPGEE
jgi:hypothetical protein